MKKIISLIGIFLLLSSCSELNNKTASEKIENQGKTEVVENDENLELSEKEKIEKLLQLYGIGLENFDIELIYDDVLTVKYNPDDGITNKIYSESGTQILIRKIVENLYEIKASKEFETYLNSVGDIYHMKKIYDIPNYEGVSGNSSNNILYTNKFVYDLGKGKIIDSNERINTYLTHTFDIENNIIVIKEIEDGTQFKLAGNISTEDMWNYFIVKDGYLSLISKGFDKVYYGKMTDSKVINLKSYNLGIEELGCGGVGNIEMYKGYLYIKDGKIITKGSCPVFINHTVFNLSEEILEKNNKWSQQGTENNFGEFHFY